MIVESIELFLYISSPPFVLNNSEVGAQEVRDPAGRSLPTVGPRHRGVQVTEGLLLPLLPAVLGGSEGAGLHPGSRESPAGLAQVLQLDEDQAIMARPEVDAPALPGHQHEASVLEVAQAGGQDSQPSLGA